MKLLFFALMRRLCSLRPIRWGMAGPRYADVERRLFDASHPSYEAARVNRLRAEIGWRLS
jgi:hypothetical protein